MLELQYNNSENQRRPSRISASICSDSLTSSGDNRNCRMLKCSTITKVPPAKSRLKQPVAGLVVATSTSTTTNNMENQATQKPSRLARLSTANNRVRPTSLSLRNVAPTARTSSQMISSSYKQQNLSTSTLPQSARRPETASSSKISVSIRSDSNKTGSNQNKSQYIQSTMKRKSSITSKKSKFTRFLFFGFSLSL